MFKYILTPHLLKIFRPSSALYETFKGLDLFGNSKDESDPPEVEKVLPKPNKASQFVNAYFYAAQKLRDNQYLVKYRDAGDVIMSAAQFLPLANKHPGKKAECQKLRPGIEDFLITSQENYVFIPLFVLLFTRIK